MGNESNGTSPPLRVLIIAENASDRFGGEAALPLRYFKLLRERGVPAWMITHARVREELATIVPNETDRIHFVEESLVHWLLWRLGELLQPRLRRVSTAFVIRLLTQRVQRHLARRLIRDHRINVVHQPTPVSPREPSLLTGLEAPLVIGPMNGDVDYPPAFRDEESALTRAAISFGRASAGLLNFVFPGKREASILLVANERSRAAMVGRTTGKIFNLSENGVDTNVWRWDRRSTVNSPTCHFAFVGRLVRSKGVDLWLQAFKQVLDGGVSPSALIIGDGPELNALQEQARAAGMLGTTANAPGKVYFAGFLPQSKVADLLATQDCLVLPTLIESGGAVLLEAMAMGLPVIATKWGGPAEYVDDNCGILVPPDSREQLIDGLADAMDRLARDPALRHRMGAAGRRRIEQHYTWDNKIDRIMDFYRQAQQETQSA